MKQALSRTSYLTLLGALLFGVLLSFYGTAVFAQGYSVVDGRIVIDTKDHWMDWEFPKDAVEITDDGWVRPVFIRKSINASLDADQFVHDGVRGGIKGVGSTPQDAVNIMDGDLNTSWGPDPSDSVEDWWIELDLGRLVSLSRIKLIFSQKGRPFQEFSIYTSTGKKIFWTDELEYELVAETTGPNNLFVLEKGLSAPGR